MSTVRIYELARELGVDSKYLLNRLKKEGKFVRSASSVVEPPVVRRLRQDVVANPPPRREGARKGHNPFAKRSQADRAYDFPSSARSRLGRSSTAAAPIGSRHNSDLDDASRIFGVPRSDLRPARSAGGGGRQIDPWLQAWIDPAEKREWLATGLSEADLAIVKQCKQIGMTPADLRVALRHGDTPVRRLRSGESVTTVRHKIKEARDQAS